MLEAIGGISVFVLTGFLLIQYHSNKEDNDRDRKRLIKYSWTADRLTYEYAKSVNSGNPIMTQKEYNRKIDKILLDERDEIQKRIDREKEEEIQFEKERRRKRKVGYKYEVIIFRIFYDNIELTQDEILRGIELEMNSNDEKAQDIFNLWLENDLIESCFWNERKFKIGTVFKSESYRIDEEDITWKEWLKENNITLKPESKEYNDWIEKHPLPF